MYVLKPSEYYISHLEMAKEAKLALDGFRRIDNRWGQEEATYYLVEACRCLPIDGKTATLVSAAEQECRRQIIQCTVEQDVHHRHILWVRLGRMALFQRRINLEKECLLRLFETRGISYGPLERARLLGACRLHCRGVPGYQSLPTNEVE